jgi:short-subunit dehydrogenase
MDVPSRGYLSGMTSPTKTPPLALVTGASTGIGRALAEEFVNHGFDVVITADEPGIREAAAELAASGRSVVPVQVDLTTPEGVEALYAEVRAQGRTPVAAALNAGIGVNGRFDQTPLEADLALVDLNVRSTVHLAKLVTRDMVANGEGRLLITSSIAAVAPGAYHATYAASKAFVHSFAEGIREELKDTGVSVTSLMPGPTETELFERADMLDTRVGAGDKDDPADVARDGFEALMDGKERVVSASLSTKAQGRGSRLLPDSVKAGMHRRMAEPGSAKD